MSITKLKHHDKCEVYIQLERYKLTGRHASLNCKNHGEWIQWLNAQDTKSMKQLGVETRPPKPINPREEWGI